MLRKYSTREMLLFSRQIKAGRAIINMSQLELAAITGLHISTIKRLENDDEALKKSEYHTIVKIKEVLEERGVKFLHSKEKNSIVGIGIRYYPVETSSSNEDLEE